MMTKNVLFFDPAFPRSGIHCDLPEGSSGLDARTLDSIAFLRNASKGSKILNLREDERLEDAIPVVFRQVIGDENGVVGVVTHSGSSDSSTNADVDAPAVTAPPQHQKGN